MKLNATLLTEVWRQMDSGKVFYLFWSRLQQLNDLTDPFPFPDEVEDITGFEDEFWFWIRDDFLSSSYCNQRSIYF